jgi:hypothetical protein
MCFRIERNQEHKPWKMDKVYKKDAAQFIRDVLAGHIDISEEFIDSWQSSDE